MSSVGEATRLSARCDLPDEVAETLAARLDGATVAFGVPTFNEGAGVHDTLDSLAAAAAECGITRFRVVLSDSSETAETVDAARAWSDRKANVELAIDRSERRRSLKEANNAILAATGADVLVIAVGDVVVPAASLAELLLALATEPRPAVAFGCSFPDPAAHGLRYRASAWQIRATWRLASLLPESYPRADGALWGAWRSFYAGYRFPVRTGSLHDDAELLRHLVEHGIPLRNAWRARALKIPSGTYEDFRRQTTRWTQVAGQRKRLRPELKAALLEGLSDPIGAACYAVYRARLAADAARHEPHSEYWEVTASAKRSPARAGCRSDRTSTSVPARMLRVGLIGLGYWGPNYARVVSELPDTSLAVACDASADATELIRIRNPATRTTTEPADVFDANDVDAVIVATPTSTHFELSLAALESGKHVLCEKPLASTVAECDELVAAADRADRTLFVSHTFIYNPAVRHLRALVESGEVGRVLYCHAARTGLGPIRQDVNALWDLAPHDLAILFYVFGREPVAAAATGQAFLHPGIEDVVFLQLRFDDGAIAGIHLSWLDPYKVRRVTVVGDRRMVVFDDVASDEKLRIFDRGASYEAVSEAARGTDFGEYKAIIRDGDIRIPKVVAAEPLKEQVAQFAECCRTGTAPETGGPEGRRVVAALEAATESLRTGGTPVELSPAVR
jgi:predicted dehydrogenase